jgi:hypothetical protein
MENAAALLIFSMAFRTGLANSLLAFTILLGLQALPVAENLNVPRTPTFAA